jgi:integrase
MMRNSARVRTINAAPRVADRWLQSPYPEAAPSESLLCGALFQMLHFLSKGGTNVEKAFHPSRAHIRRYQGYLNRAAIELGRPPDDVSPDDLFGWVCAQRATMTAGAWRTVKSLCARVMQHLGASEPDAAIAENLLRVGQMLTNPSRMLFSERGDLTPAVRIQTSTEAQYEKLFTRNWKAFNRSLANPEDPEQNNPVAFASWLLTEHVKWDRNTWRLYRRACIVHLQREEARQRGSETLAAVFSQAIGMLSASVGSTIQPNPSRERRTSSGRAKFITEDELNQLIALARETRGVWAYRAVTATIADIACGLRSAEWLDAELLDDRYIKVRNSKAPEVETPAPNVVGRAKVQAPAELKGLPPDAYDAPREYRYIPLDLFGNPERLKAHVSEHLRMLRDWSRTEPTQTYWDRCNEALRSLRRRGRSIGKVSLHSARHQFSANLKARYTEPIVAYLMGHASDETATTHYGKRRKAWKALGARLDADVAALFDREKAFGVTAPQPASETAAESPTLARDDILPSA